jgi:hypothetical protein
MSVPSLGVPFILASALAFAGCSTLTQPPLKRADGQPSVCNGAALLAYSPQNERMLRQSAGLDRQPNMSYHPQTYAFGNHNIFANYHEGKPKELVFRFRSVNGVDHLLKIDNNSSEAFTWGLGLLAAASGAGSLANVIIGGSAGALSGNVLDDHLNRNRANFMTHCTREILAGHHDSVIPAKHPAGSVVIPAQDNTPDRNAPQNQGRRLIIQ